MWEVGSFLSALPVSAAWRTKSEGPSEKGSAAKSYEPARLVPVLDNQLAVARFSAEGFAAAAVGGEDEPEP
ncbi:hypothetical protein ACFWIB_28390 [Streptomyces sp. NPDC127051]|uniref:hypothetical protein n=1 Tax=Streptomyces sp. NPDC127051 TaxID=3347119 RepID=UPI003646ED8E